MNTFKATNFTAYEERLGKSVVEIETELGKPLKQTDEEGEMYYWYGSIVPHKATLYRFKDGIMVWDQIDISKENLPLDEFVKAYGEPELSVKQFSSGGDDLRSKVVSWPGQGREIIVNGEDRYAKVARVAFFDPISKEEYSQTFGHKFAQNVSINMLVTSTPTISRTTQQTQESFIPSTLKALSGKGILLQGALVTVIVVILIYALWVGKKHNTKK